MESIKQLENKLKEAKSEVLEKIKELKEVKKIFLQNKKSEEVKKQYWELILEVCMLYEKVYKLEYVADRVYELQEIKSKVFNTTFLALTKTESESLMKTVNAAIDRWLSK